MTREDVRVHVTAPYHILPRILEIIHTTIILTRAWVRLLRSSDDSLRFAEDQTAQEKMFNPFLISFTEYSPKIDLKKTHGYKITSSASN